MFSGGGVTSTEYAAAFAPHAAELMAPIQLAMQHGIAFEDLSAAPFAHPTLSELLSL